MMMRRRAVRLICADVQGTLINRRVTRKESLTKAKRDKKRENKGRCAVYHKLMQLKNEASAARVATVSIGWAGGV